MCHFVYHFAYQLAYQYPTYHKQSNTHDNQPYHERFTIYIPIPPPFYS